MKAIVIFGIAFIALGWETNAFADSCKEFFDSKSGSFKIHYRQDKGAWNSFPFVVERVYGTDSIKFRAWWVSPETWKTEGTLNGERFNFQSVDPAGSVIDGRGACGPSEANGTMGYVVSNTSGNLASYTFYLERD